MAMRSLIRQIYQAIPFKRPIFERLRALNIPERLYRHLYFQGPFEIAIDSGHGFSMNSYGAVIENDLFWAGFGRSWEATSLKIWAALCRDRRGLILDIGANTGVYALAAQSLAPDARVIAFEPVARVAAKLRLNASLNGNRIEVVEKAVSERSGTMILSDVPSEHNYSASLEGQGPSAVHYNVETCSIDELLGASWPNGVGPIKIDIERHEPAAIRGMAETLRRYRPPILIEVLDATIGRAIETGLRGVDYDYYHIDEQAGLIRADHLAPLRDQHWNHLLCTKEDFERTGLNRFLAS